LNRQSEQSFNARVHLDPPRDRFSDRVPADESQNRAVEEVAVFKPTESSVVEVLWEAECKVGPMHF
jgi:hypothetical protein